MSYGLCINKSNKTIPLYDDIIECTTRVGSIGPRKAYSCGKNGDSYFGVYFRDGSGNVRWGCIPVNYIVEHGDEIPNSFFTDCTDCAYDGRAVINGETFYTFKFRRNEEVYTAAGTRWGTVASGMRVACRTDMMGEDHPEWKGINYVASSSGGWVKVTGDGYNYGFVDIGLDKGAMPNTISMYGNW